MSTHRHPSAHSASGWEAGQGVSEGFELAEAQLTEAASHSGRRFSPLGESFAVESGGSSAVYGESDHEDSSEVPTSDR